MPITKKLRFEIFKRDGFTCQYCGKTPPDVVLEVDHIDPSKFGSSDDQEACSDAISYVNGILYNRHRDQQERD